MSKVFKAVGNAFSGVAKAVTNVVGGVVKAVGSIVSGVVKAVGNVLSAVVNFVASPFMGLFGMPDTPSNNTEAERITGVLVQRQGTNVNIPVVYGFRKVAGTVVFAETGSDNNKYLWVAYVLSEGPCEGVHQVWINDILIPNANVIQLNNQQLATITDTTNKLAGKTQLQMYKGLLLNTPSQTNVGAAVKAGIFAGSPSFTNTMHYNGLCTIFARYEWKEPSNNEEANNNPFGGGIPELKVTLLGRKITPLLSSNPESSEYGTVAQQNAQVYSTNPAEILLDYLRNPFYGKGLVNSDIDWSSWKIAAAKCNQQVTYITGVTGPILKVDYVLDTGQTIFNNVKLLLQNFRAYMPYSRGKYVLKIEDAGNATDILSGSTDIVASFDKDNLHGDITYTGIDRASKYNQVVVRYVDPDNFWSEQTVVFPTSESERQRLQSIDGGRENKGEFTFAGVTNYAIAYDMARLLFNKSRYQDSLNFTVSSQGFELEPGDSVYLNANILKFGDNPNANAIPWRIVSTKLNDDFTFSVGCVRNPDFIYPHVRAGEIDYKYAAYVPKGATRYYPPEPQGIPIGLRPPTGAPISPTDPNLPPTTPGTGTGALTDEVSINSMTSITRNGQFYGAFAFNQPNNAMYGGVTVFWRQNITSATTWNQLEVNIRPGPGLPITFEIGPLVNNTQYVLGTRVKYTSGESSVRTTAWTFNVGTVGSGGGGGTPTPPTTPVVTTKDNFMSYVYGVTVPNGTSTATFTPKSPRLLRFTVRQDMALGANAGLNALEIFFKRTQNAKWSYIKRPLTEQQGSDVNFDLTCGLPVYPLVPGVDAPAAVDNYDFIFRWAYSDGTSSTFQWRAVNANVEWAGSYLFPVFGNSVGQIFAKELSSSYVPEIAGPNDIVETRNISINLFYVKDNEGNIVNPTDPRIKFYVNPPVVADRINWAGIRVYRRKAGIGNSITYVDTQPAIYYLGEWRAEAGITFDEVWEYVIVPLVYYGDSIAEAFNGFYVSGLIHNRARQAGYPPDGNWLSYMRVDAPEPVATAKDKLGTAIQVSPRKDAFIDTFNSATVLTGGIPSSPRKLSFTFKQSIANGLNGNIKGIVVYYKQADLLYWKRSVYTIPTPYLESTAPNITFTTTDTVPQMDVGYPSWPNFPGRDQKYDFVVRYLISDDSETTWESVWTARNIENAGFPGDPVLSFSFLGSGIAGKRASTDIVTEDKAPPGAVIDVKDILTSTSMAPNLLFAVPQDSSRRLQFFFSQPISALRGYLAGFRILRRQVILGTNPPFTTDDSNIPYRTGTPQINGVATDCILAESINTTWQVEYEWAVIPLVWVAGVRTEANQCLYYRGKVCDQDNGTGANPYTFNWYSRRAAQIVSTSGIRNTLSTAFPDVDPTVRVQTIRRTNAFVNGDGGFHTVTYQVPASFVSATIYRRSVMDMNRSDVPASIGGFTTKGRYFWKHNFNFAGRWERIDINNTNNPLTTLADGTKTQTVNLRPAIAHGEFNDAYNPSLPLDSSLVQKLYSGFSNTAPLSRTPAVKLDLVGPGSGQYNITQLFIVITYNSGSGNVLSNYGVRVDLYDSRYYTAAQSPTGVAGWFPDQPGNLITDVSDAILTTAMESAMDTTSLDFTELTSLAQPRSADASTPNLLRKMSSARTPVADGSINRPRIGFGQTTYAKPSTTPPCL